VTLTVGIRELTHRTGPLVRSVAAGERIIITDRGLPIVDLVPHSDSEGRLRREAAITSSINAMLATVTDAQISANATMSDDVLGGVEW
jgi:prevent-host-death family protein